MTGIAIFAKKIRIVFRFTPNGHEIWPTLKSKKCIWFPYSKTVAFYHLIVSMPENIFCHCFNKLTNRVAIMI